MWGLQKLAGSGRCTRRPAPVLASAAHPAGLAVRLFRRRPRLPHHHRCHAAGGRSAAMVTGDEDIEVHESGGQPLRLALSTGWAQTQPHRIAQLHRQGQPIREPNRGTEWADIAQPSHGFGAIFNRPDQGLCAPLPGRGHPRGGAVPGLPAHRQRPGLLRGHQPASMPRWSTSWPRRMSTGPPTC